ncbi:MAG: GNAT family N-acetyltransferase [Cyclobacteriaceae bacterium]
MIESYCMPLQPADLPDLQRYFERLSPETKSRFGPHRFDLLTLKFIYQANDQHLGYLIRKSDDHEIIGYSAVKGGYLEHDANRLQRYGLALSEKLDCTFAPSLADDYQGHGFGSKMFDYILMDLKTKGFRRIILWGGVQCNNHRAVRYYEKLGFRSVGQFEYNGLNLDMLLDI